MTAADPKPPATGDPAAGVSSSADVPSPENLRRRSIRLDEPVRRPSLAGIFTPSTPVEGHRRRRSSTLSAYSFSEATRDLQDEIIDPGPVFQQEVMTWKSWLPMVFTVVPLVAGLIFKNGTAFFTDLIIIFLSMVFLHWSVSAPWKWYHAAQQVRQDQEAVLMEALELEDAELAEPAARTPASDSESISSTAPSPADKQEQSRQAGAALAQLQTLEVAALVVCFVAPAAATYLLSRVRSHLSRPPQSLVSDFNLTIFLLAAEIMPLKHCIKLVLAHTLHLQRIVNSNPYRAVHITPAKYRDMVQRLEALEARAPPVAPPPPPPSPPASNPDEEFDGQGGGGRARGRINAEQLRDDVTRAVRAAITPDVDGVIRAVRRYEKKTSALTEDMERQMRDIRARLDDAIALSAVVARSNAEGSGWGLLGKVAGGLMRLPIVGMVYLLALALAPVAGLWRRAAGRLLHGRRGHRGGGRRREQWQAQERVLQMPVKHARIVAPSGASSPRAASRAAPRVS
ncbi:hypothetical protein N658DRAFT_563470 [Parathielavia hyrcaniae]|uniref:Uncharacterized protein n=1 Tax=Parathielavia hyrcaniae TaxID=113614 RepID=A0AAN6T7E1_9PEZI|nr:hypothetical protein N658DRAFT_563470 [Parathielavia hyrcaniae]